MKTKTGITTEKSLAVRMEITEKLSHVTTEIAKVSRTLDDKKRIVETATRTLESFKKEAADQQATLCGVIHLEKHYANVFHEDRLMSQDKEYYAGLMKKVTTAENEVSHFSELQEDLKNEKITLLDKLSELDDPLSEILMFQENITEARNKVAAIQAAISSQDDIFKKAVQDSPSIVELLQKRQDILADIATGCNVGSALDDLDKLIKSERQKASKVKEIADVSIENAQQSIVGLHRKLSTAQLELKKLADQEQKIKTAFIMYEAEKVGSEYLLLAEELAGRYKQLIALDTILAGTGGSSIDDGAMIDFWIPAFNIQAHKKYKECLYDGPGYFSSINNGDNLNSEKVRIEALGVNL